jgi:hypothetical protein
VVVFDNTSADFVLISADAILKMRIAQLCSENEWTLADALTYTTFKVAFK